MPNLLSAKKVIQKPSKDRLVLTTSQKIKDLKKLKINTTQTQNLKEQLENQSSNVN